MRLIDEFGIRNTQVELLDQRRILQDDKDKDLTVRAQLIKIGTILAIKFTESPVKYDMIPKEGAKTEDWIKFHGVLKEMDQKDKDVIAWSTRCRSYMI